MPPRRTAPLPQTAPPKPLAATPSYLRYAILALTVFALFAMFTDEIGDADTWIHLRTGQWMVANHKLPIPDPFSWTTYLGQSVYPAEYATRDLNLKHEWLGQVIVYLVWAAGGPTGMVLFRAACVSGFCLVIGWIVWRRTRSFWLAIGAVFAASTLARGIAVDRPYYITYLLLALTVLLMERRRPLWLLPPLFLFWANLHGGYFMGLVVVGAYCGEALVERLRGKPPADERTLWVASIAAIVAAAINPAVYGVIPGMLAYRQSYMQNTLREWHSPAVWPLEWYSGLLLGAIVVMLAAWRRVRVVDWFLFSILAALSYTAARNVIFIALVAPIMIATYLPKFSASSSASEFIRSGRLRVVAGYAATLVIILLTGQRLASGHAFQFRVASWKFPDGAVNFLKDHHVSAPMFNLYEWGGYLMWAAYPQEKTFVDGRALNESVFKDYMRIAFNSADLDFSRLDLRSRAGQDLLDRYGAEVILLEGFEYGQGTPYFLAAAIAIDPRTPWKLVFQDNAAMVFMRQPPPGVQPLPLTQVFTSLEAQCANHMRNQPGSLRCARGLGDLYARLNALDRASFWLKGYLDRAGPDPAIESLYQQIRSGTFHAPTR